MLLFFFFNDTATTEIYTLSLHDALPILQEAQHLHMVSWSPFSSSASGQECSSSSGSLSQVHGSSSPILSDVMIDRKSTRLNSSHANISYAVFCLKKKKKLKIRFIPFPIV